MLHAFSLNTMLRNISYQSKYFSEFINILPPPSNCGVDNMQQCSVMIILFHLK